MRRRRLPAEAMEYKALYLALMQRVGDLKRVSDESFASDKEKTDFSGNLIQLLRLLYRSIRANIGTGCCIHTAAAHRCQALYGVAYRRRDST